MRGSQASEARVHSELFHYCNRSVESIEDNALGYLRSRTILSVAVFAFRLPTPHRATWMLLQGNDLDDVEREMTEELCQLFPNLM